jgi:hypothetical protein
VVALRFGWPAPLEAEVTYRRTRTRTGAPPSRFVARYRTVAEPDGPTLRLRTEATRWEGDLPVPADHVADAIRASEAVVQRVGASGAFAGLEGVEAMRPVLEPLLAAAGVPAEQTERALGLAEGAIQAEAEELWNLAVGFWTDADLALGARYVMRAETALPFASGLSLPSTVEFQVRRRTPCAAGETVPRCVEVTLREVPDPDALRRASRTLIAWIAGGEEPPDDAEEVAVESELVLVTDPQTLLPRRLAWTRTVRAEAADRREPALEAVDRSEYDYHYPPPPAAPRPKAPAPVSRAAAGRNPPGAAP